MPLPKIDEVRNLSDEDISQQVLETKKQLFDLRLQQATGQLEKTHQFKHLRHRLAQLLTVERERELEAAAKAPAESTPAPAESAPEPAPEPAAATETEPEADSDSEEEA
jgi:large subunit ribosomal protein L29